MLSSTSQLLRSTVLAANQLNNHIYRVCTKHVSTTPLLFQPQANKEANKPILYSFWSSSCSWRVRITLNLKNIPYEIKPINLLKSGGEQHTEEYRMVNPMKVVPTLQIDGRSIIESVAIMHYLDETRPQPPLLPQDVYKRAKVREVVEIICSGIQPLQNLGILKYMGDKKLDWAQQCINRGFSALEVILSSSAGKFCFGDELTMADCCLLPQVFNARRYKVDMSQYPIISRIETELLKVPAFADAHPNKQPDYPTK
ncbi:probable maleylacetoacetate isomerase 2 [Eurosta solidaginis]|uniref:probable maleylacetoacetate isomerase 2 n=1 Tax=Eurosta solidaginis TaxID=178769 RepID=UPI003530FFA7